MVKFGIKPRFKLKELPIENELMWDLYFRFNLKKKKKTIFAVVGRAVFGFN
jgi:hypothetical protein